MRSATFAIGTACAVFATMLTAGCASGTRSSASSRAEVHSRPPVVFSPPHVDRPRLKASQLRHGATLLSGGRIAFVTSGSSNCYWTPTRVTIITRHWVRINMGMAQYGSACLLNLVSFPVAVAVGQGLVDTGRPVKVRLAYQTHYSGEGVKRWHRTLVAPPLAAG